MQNEYEIHHHQFYNQIATAKPFKDSGVKKSYFYSARLHVLKIIIIIFNFLVTFKH